MWRAILCTSLIFIPAICVPLAYRRGHADHERHRLLHAGLFSLIAFWPMLFYYAQDQDMASGTAGYLLILTALCCFAMLMRPHEERPPDDDHEPPSGPPEDDPPVDWPELEKRFREEFDKHRSRDRLPA